MFYATFIRRDVRWFRPCRRERVPFRLDWQRQCTHGAREREGPSKGERGTAAGGDITRPPFLLSRAKFANQNCGPSGFFAECIPSSAIKGLLLWSGCPSFLLPGSVVRMGGEREKNKPQDIATGRWKRNDRILGVQFNTASFSNWMDSLGGFLGFQSKKNRPRPELLDTPSHRHTYNTHHCSVCKQMPCFTGEFSQEVIIATRVWLLSMEQGKFEGPQAVFVPFGRCRSGNLQPSEGRRK